MKVFETILGLADLRPGGASAPVEDIRVLYIGAPSYDLAKCVITTSQELHRLAMFAFALVSVRVCV